MSNIESTSAELYRLAHAEEQQWADGAQRTPTELLREQRERGFAMLWFRPELEADFCRYLRLSGRFSRLTLLTIALLAMAITPLIDTTLLGMPEQLVPLSRWMQLGGMVPLLLGAGLFCWKRPEAAAIELLMVLLFLGFIAGLLGQRIVDARYGFDLPVEFIGICTVTMFALARIRFWVMLPAAVVASMAAIGVEAAFIHIEPNVNYHMFATVVLMVVAVCAGYSLEYFIRWTWLNGTLLHYLSRQDSLTGLLNRYALEDALEQAQAQAARESASYAVAMIDIDAFGAYNDHYGHQDGDAALRRVSAILRAGARRPLDVCGRYGGEEFAMLWMHGDADEIRGLAENVRAAIEAERMPHGASPVAEWVTVSIGVCHIGPDDGRVGLSAALRKADALLYEAKARGRNRVLCERFSAWPCDEG